MSVLRRFCLTVLVALCVLGLPAGTASAHNSLLSSDPADGSTVPAAPSQMTFVFANAVPLDTMTLEYIDATGVRRDLTELAHGPGGDTEVTAALPPLTAGEINVRWRLVGPDGHPITGRVNFTIVAPAATTVATTAAPATTIASIVDPGTTSTVAGAATTQMPTPSTTLPAVVSAVSADDSSGGFDAPWVVPDATRWIFRMVSYLAIMMIAGIVTTSAFVWRAAWAHPVLRRVTAWAVVAVASLAVVQLLVIVSDIAGTAPWSSLASLSGALDTDAGVALAVRAALAVALAAVLFTGSIPAGRRWPLAGAGIVALLATWAFAGHSRSMRWPVLGIPLDVAHHIAAAAWLGGLAIVGLVTLRRTQADEAIDSVQRFARLARVAVVIIAATGVLQALRLIGSPGRLLAADHGRYLVLKIAVLAVMLWVADVNRRRVNQKFRRAATATPVAMFDLRRAMGIEMFLGIAVIGVTAMMVVSPPAVTDASMSGETPAATTIAAAGLRSVTTPSSRAVCAITTSLTMGAASTEVACLRELLAARSVSTGTPSGQSDAETETAVRTFQAGAGVAVDGVVGPAVAVALGAATG